MSEATIERFRTPTRYDLEPYGSLWHIKIDEDCDVWIQASKDQLNPNWIRLGVFLACAFEDKLTPEFIKECLEFYESKGNHATS